jgi:hypothetical protein
MNVTEGLALTIRFGVSFGTSSAVKGKEMRRAFASLIFAAVLASGVVPSSAQSSPPEKQKKESSKSRGAALTGCVDEVDGHYVLIDSQSRAAVADLEAEGFPTEGFAKYLGHKVTVRGTSSPGTVRPLFRVRGIETVSETCEPEAFR